MCNVTPKCNAVMVDHNCYSVSSVYKAGCTLKGENTTSDAHVIRLAFCHQGFTTFSSSHRVKYLLLVILLT